MIQGLFLQIVSGVLGFWLASLFVEGLSFTGPWTDIIVAGVILGAINSFVKPVLKIITTPFRMITFGLLGLIINLVIILAVDIFMPNLVIEGAVPLFWTMIVVWLSGLFVGLLGRGKIGASPAPKIP